MSRPCDLVGYEGRAVQVDLGIAMCGQCAERIRTMRTLSSILFWILLIASLGLIVWGGMTFGDEKWVVLLIGVAGILSIFLSMMFCSWLRSTAGVVGIRGEIDEIVAALRDEDWYANPGLDDYVCCSPYDSRKFTEYIDRLCDRFGLVVIDCETGRQVDYKGDRDRFYAASTTVRDLSPD
ncbi:MAG: hypothetical protein NC336_06740 [Clostridium sp.]|nr:hypothetical protein [Clostridium sp.]